MKKVININFQGVVVPIEESAYDILQQYIESLRSYFANEEGKDEIINDIESRISELFQQRLKNGATCITDNDVNVIIDNMGRPKDFAEAESDENTSNSKKANEEESTHSSSQFNWQYRYKQLYRDDTNKILGGVCSGIANYLNIDPWIVRILFIISGVGFLAYMILWIFLPSSQSLSVGAGRRLYRNPDDRIVAGVCGGIGSYFNINPWIPRVIFLLPFFTFFFRWANLGWGTFPHFWGFTFSPGTLIIYIILWIVIPEARTTSEKLQMKGEKVDLNSIKESVVKEMKGVSERLEKMGKDAGNYMKENGPQMRQEFAQTVNRSGGALGRIILILFKVFAYIILGSIAFAILAVVFALGVAAVGVFPLKNFIVTDGWQNVLAWLTLIFFVGVLVVGMIVFIIRLLAKRRSTNNYYRNTMIGLWIFGWICLFALISFVGRDFKYISTPNEHTIGLSDPGINSLVIMPVRKIDFRWKPWLSFEPYSVFNIGDDTAFVPNIKLRILQSTDSSFHVKYLTMSNGYSRQEADNLALKIPFGGYQQDSTLYLNNQIPINTNDKFRNQFVEVSVFVPVNRRIKVDRDFVSVNRAKFFLFRGWDGYDSDFSDSFTSYDYDRDVQYVMKENGLQRTDDWNDDSNDDRPGEKYKYRGPGQIDSLKNQQEKQIEQMEKSLDSAKGAHQKELKQMKDSLLNQRNEIDKKIKNIQGQAAMINVLPPVFQWFTVPFISSI